MITASIQSATRIYSRSLNARDNGIIRDAVEGEYSVVATNSDGSEERREYLLGLLGADATEEVVDPGREVVTARLSGH